MDVDTHLVEISGATARCIERHRKVVLEMKVVFVAYIYDHDGWTPITVYAFCNYIDLLFYMPIVTVSNMSADWSQSSSQSSWVMGQTFYVTKSI